MSLPKDAEIIRVDIDPYNLQREIHEGRKGEKCFCVSAEDVVRKLTEQQAQIGSYEEWLAVCQKIRKELEQVDDADTAALSEPHDRIFK